MLFVISSLSDKFRHSTLKISRGVVVIAIASLYFTTSCVEVTSTQRDYVSSRDECREYSESRSSSNDFSNKDEKNKLLGHFSDCMNKRGWSVSAPAEKPKDGEVPPVEAIAKAPAKTPPPAISAAPIATQAPEARPYFDADIAERCAYAQHARNHSSVARKIAIECEASCKIGKELTESCQQKIKKPHTQNPKK